MAKRKPAGGGDRGAAGRAAVDQVVEAERGDTGGAELRKVGQDVLEELAEPSSRHAPTSCRATRRRVLSLSESTPSKADALLGPSAPWSMAMTGSGGPCLRFGRAGGVGRGLPMGSPPTPLPIMTAIGGHRRCGTVNARRP